MPGAEEKARIAESEPSLAGPLMKRRPFLRSLAGTLALTPRMPAADPPNPPEDPAFPLNPDEAKALNARLEADFLAAEAAVKTAPDAVSAYSRRGDAHLFLGRFREARADFDEMIRRDPHLDVGHWRLGIALYFIGEFEKSAAQFEKYHRYDARDRENGIWHFFGRAKVDGIEKARSRMLLYERFDREPFPLLYDMFAGRRTTADLLAHIAKPELARLGSVQFFGLYYAGVNEALLGNPKKGRTLIGQAVAHPWGKTSEGGPGYMWNVARLSDVEFFKLKKM